MGDVGAGPAGGAPVLVADDGEGEAPLLPVWAAAMPLHVDAMKMTARSRRMVSPSAAFVGQRHDAGGVAACHALVRKLT
jgi:hypothetical protein